MCIKASDMAGQVRVLAAKSEDLRLRAHVEGEKSTPKVVLFSDLHAHHIGFLKYSFFLE